MASAKAILRLLRTRKSRYRNYLREIISFVIAWVICIFFYSLILYVTYLEVEIYDYTFSEWLGFTFSVGVIIGVINGLFEVLLFNRLFRKMRFIYIVLNKTFFLVLAFFLTLIIYTFAHEFILVPLGIASHHPDDTFDTIIHSLKLKKHAVVVLLFNFGINYFMQLRKKMGKGVMLNLFLGKYHRPRKEDRIVMFLDLTSSTEIAERLGIYEYSSFVKDFFFDIDDAINESKGAIFQFVGDEVVILWNPKDGSENNNCINFFFKAQKIIYNRRNIYLKKYGVYPEFKAGIHFGTVVITEVGGSKREIAYHGDTINTAARIRSTCRKYNECLLVSAELLSRLPELDRNYTIESAGVTNFKGKKNVVGLFSIYLNKL